MTAGLLVRFSPGGSDPWLPLRADVRPIHVMAATGPGGHFQLYCTGFKNGKYQTPRLLSFSAGKYGGVDPAVAPDQSFIVFASNRPPTPMGDSYAFIAFRNHGRWSNPISLGSYVNGLGKIDELRLGPDGRTLYLTSNHIVPVLYPKTTDSGKAALKQMQSWNDGNNNIWSVSPIPWLNAHSQIQSSARASGTSPTRLSQ